ncbi:RhoGAP domain protein, partial [Teladorsagia circumcincta]
EGGLEMEGLYRVPGNQAQLSELEKAFREKGDVDIASLDMPVHVVATAVKNFFSCLAEPLIPTELHQDILDCINGSEVASSPSTAMDAQNLSKVLFPTLFRPQFNDFLEMSSGTAKFQQATERRSYSSFAATTADSTAKRERLAQIFCAHDRTHHRTTLLGITKEQKHYGYRQ